MFLATAVSYGQQALPSGIKLISPSFSATSNGSKLAILHTRPSGAVGFSWDQIYLETPTGSSHLSFPFTFGSPVYMEFINGELHVACNKYIPGSWDRMGLLCKYQNGNWIALDSVNGIINAGTMHQGQMYLAGFINDSLRQLKGVVRYTNGGFQQAGQLNTVDTILSLESHGNTLFATGLFPISSSSGTAQIMAYDLSSNTWSTPISEAQGFNPSGHSRKWSFNTSFFYNSTSYFIRDSTIYEVRNDSLFSIYQMNLSPANPYWWNNTGVIHLDGKVYINSGQNIVELDSNAFRALDPGLNGHEITVIVPYKNQIYGSYIGWSVLSGIPFDYCFSWDPKAALGKGALQGQTYYDSNNNCIADTNELQSIPFLMKFHDTRTGKSQQMGFNRNYSLQLLRPGLYVVDSVIPVLGNHQNLKWISTCVGDTFRIDTNSSPTIFDIPFQFNGAVDYSIEITSGSNVGFRQGFNEWVDVDVINSNPFGKSGLAVEIIIPPGTNMTYSNLNPAQVNGDTLRFNLPHINRVSRYSLLIDLEITLATNLNDTIFVLGRIINGLDSNMLNNFDTLSGRVMAAYDPNDKTPSLHESLPGLERLDYAIRFQNTGNDTAFTVIVRDTLESYFDPLSIVLGGSSHDFEFSMVDGNVMVWTFNNILLPDSATDPRGSIGFFNFSIDVDPSLGIGSVIDNDAEIYFDFQPPVHTNHAQTFIVSQLSLADLEPNDLIAYPNPVKDFLTLEETEGLESAVLLDLFGRKVKEWNFDQNAKRQNLDFSEVAPGTYLLRIGLKSVKLIKPH